MSTSEDQEYENEQKDKRGAVRAAIIVEKIPCEDGQKTFFGYARNLSRGGLFISTVKPREIGEEFDLLISLPTPDRFVIRSRCEVVWKQHFQRKGEHEPGMGLRFLDLSDEAGNRIDAWVDAQVALNTG
ncbi:MAG: PilZ domain-containing protein [Desulfuromonadales bacterium]|nr:PilZ domain-containing protein [Desulfuromonadales bacterium]